MVIDSSAVMAILLDEPDGAAFANIVLDNRSIMASPNFLECCIVADRQADKNFGLRLEPLIDALAISVVPFEMAEVQLARLAYSRFGRGVHPACLNMGDCCAYALAKSRGEPLLFKGGGFPQTDIMTAFP